MRILILAFILFLMLITGCTESPIVKDYLPVNDNVILIGTTSSDYSSSNLDILTTSTRSTAKNQLKLHTDHLIRVKDGAAYILERSGKDNIIRYDYKNNVIGYQENLGSGINIQDIAFVSSTKAYITAYQSSDLIVFNPETGKKVKVIDLSAYNSFAGTDSAESVPFMSSIMTYENKVLVACQRLQTVQGPWGSTWAPGDSSCILIIDTESDQVEEAIILNKKNPAAIDTFGNRLFVSCSGSWFDPTDGGVEMIDLANFSNLGVVAEESAFEGNIGNIAAVSLQKVYVCTGKNTEDFSKFWTEVIPLNPTLKTIGSKLESVKDGSGGIVFDGEMLYVGDRDLTSPGVVIIDPETDSLNERISTGLPPSAVAFSE